MMGDAIHCVSAQHVCNIIYFSAQIHSSFFICARRARRTSGATARGIVAAAKPYQADRSAPSRTSGATVRVGGAGMSEANRA